MVRRVAAIALRLPALAGLFAAAMLVATADERIGKDRFYLDCFEAAAGAKPGTASAAIRAAARERYGPAYADCPPIHRDSIIDAEDVAFAGRVAARPRQVIWSFWRGEWSEYYAAASGETTLLTTRRRYWRTLLPVAAVWLGIAWGCLAAAWRAWPVRRQPDAGISTSSVSGT